MKTIVLTGGGSAGHVTPNLALLPYLKKENYKIKYIGSISGIEREIIEKEGLEYFPIQSGKLRRYFSLKNLTDIARIKLGILQAFFLLKKIKPDVVFSKGGFVSCPVVWAAWLNRIPVIIHESDITPGLANKLSIPFAKKICYTFPETAKHLSGNKGEMTGLPLRDFITKGDFIKGFSFCKFTSRKPVILAIGGSLGAKSINDGIHASLDELLKDFQICHICGKGNINKDLLSIEGYAQFEYVNEELANIFAMTDLIISRAGATLLNEILLLKKPNLLIPLSKNQSRGDQILNAASFKKMGLSSVLHEEDLTKESFYSAIMEVWKNREAYISKIEKVDINNAAEKVVKIINDYI